MTPTPARVLIVVQNLPVPRDRRVWLEACALRDAGFGVAVVCPKGPGDPSFDVIDGIVVRKYAPPPATSSVASFVLEFAYCWLMTARLVIRAARNEGFDVIQACNPPDTYWALAAPYKLFGKRFVFDQHDLCPEVYESRFKGGSRLLRSALRLLERASYAVADHVIVTNESYRATALQRGRVPAERLTVVRTGPDVDRLQRTAPDPQWQCGRRYLCAYLGVMGPQDGVDLALRAIADLRALGRDDVHFVFMGDGDSLQELQDLAVRLDIMDAVTFTGWADDEVIASVLSTAHVALCPDPLNPLNDVSTMNKTLEYMAFELPIVSFDLRETRFSAGPAAIYVRPNDTMEFAREIAQLVDDPERREQMGRIGRERIEREFSWQHSAPRYVEVFSRLARDLAGARSRS